VLPAELLHEMRVTRADDDLVVDVRHVLDQRHVVGEVVAQQAADDVLCHVVAAKRR
jgi:hypothetical protein